MKVKKHSKTKQAYSIYKKSTSSSLNASILNSAAKIENSQYKSVILINQQGKSYERNWMQKIKRQLTKKYYKSAQVSYEINNIMLITDYLQNYVTRQTICTAQSIKFSDQKQYIKEYYRFNTHQTAKINQKSLQQQFQKVVNNKCNDAVQYIGIMHFGKHIQNIYQKYFEGKRSLLLKHKPNNLFIKPNYYKKSQQPTVLAIKYGQKSQTSKNKLNQKHEFEKVLRNSQLSSYLMNNDNLNSSQTFQFLLLNNQINKISEKIQQKNNNKKSNSKKAQCKVKPSSLICSKNQLFSQIKKNSNDCSQKKKQFLQRSKQRKKIINSQLQECKNMVKFKQSLNQISSINIKRQSKQNQNIQYPQNYGLQVIREKYQTRLNQQRKKLSNFKIQDYDDNYLLRKAVTLPSSPKYKSRNPSISKYQNNSKTPLIQSSRHIQNKKLTVKTGKTKSCFKQKQKNYIKNILNCKKQQHGTKILINKAEKSQSKSQKSKSRHKQKITQQKSRLNNNDLGFKKKQIKKNFKQQYSEQTIGSSQNIQNQYYFIGHKTNKNTKQKMQKAQERKSGILFKNIANIV